MKRTLRRFACLTALFSVIVFSANAQQQVEQIPALFSTGLPEAASPEDGLPAGAIAYIRLNNALTLLDNLDSFASTIVPEKALPPEFAEIFAKPKPIVTFLGMQLAGQPIPLEEFPARLGIALDRPIALAIYPMPTKRHKLALPLENDNQQNRYHLKNDLLWQKRHKNLL